MTHDDPLFPAARRSRSIWLRTGVPRAHRRLFDGVLAAVLALFAVGWSLGIARAAGRTPEPMSLARRLTSNPLSTGGAPETAYLLDALVRRFADVSDFRGESGALRVIVAEPGETPRLPLDSVPEDVDVVLQPVDSAGREASAGGGGAQERAGAGAAGGAGAEGGSGAGAWNVVLQSGRASRILPNLTVLTQMPLSERRSGRIGEYLIGEWPFESGGTPPSEAYETPRGAVQVTPENVDLPVSDHFTLGDFLTKGQDDVWPKYVVLSTRLLDKLELTLQELERMGHPVENVGVISGFRTPSYNAHGGNTAGRGSLSRHMYGDAMDFYIDNDRDQRMDDLNGDGTVDVGDARVLARAAERVERRYPRLVGGIGTYSPTGAHAGFVHVDTRGYEARW